MKIFEFTANLDFHLLVKYRGEIFCGGTI